MRHGPEIDRDIILGEISGKNAAIHAYDGIGWKIRTGFLTLFFLGWGIVLKGYAEGVADRPHDWESLIDRMLVVSVGLTFGGWMVDRNYLKHKFRVILALDNLIEAIWSTEDGLKSVSVELLKVAGDRSEMPYDCKGFKEAARTGLCVFWIPLIAVAVAAFVL
jgi:hypothetical protein